MRLGGDFGLAVLINANVICCRGLTSDEIRQQNNKIITLRLSGFHNKTDYDSDFHKAESGDMMVIKVLNTWVLDTFDEAEQSSDINVDSVPYCHLFPISSKAVGYTGHNINTIC